MDTNDANTLCNNNEKCFKFKNDCIAINTPKDLINKAFTNDTLKAMVTEV